MSFVRRFRLPVRLSTSSRFNFAISSCDECFRFFVFGCSRQFDRKVPEYPRRAYRVRSTACLAVLQKKLGRLMALSACSHVRGIYIKLWMRRTGSLVTTLVPFCSSSFSVLLPLLSFLLLYFAPSCFGSGEFRSSSQLSSLSRWQLPRLNELVLFVRSCCRLDF